MLLQYQRSVLSVCLDLYFIKCLTCTISCLQGPPVVASVTSKRKKGEKNKQKGRSSMGELLVLPFLSKFPIPSDVNTPVTKTINEYVHKLFTNSSINGILHRKMCMLSFDTVINLFMYPCCKIDHTTLDPTQINRD